MADIFGTIFGAGANIALGALNNAWAEQQQAEARRQNYMYGEMAANNADLRTRALYNDFYSPKALLEQYREAGLSPSLMFGGTPGQGGQSGAMGTGAAGLGTPFMPMSMLEGAQIANIAADTNKKKAEAANISEDTKIKLLQEEWDNFRNKEKSVEFSLSTLYLTDKDGNNLSLFELAENCYDYDKFIQEARNRAQTMGEEGNYIIREMGTEIGQKTMREIYMASNRFERDIKILSYEGGNADFQQNIIDCLKKQDFAKQNAQTALKQIKAAGEMADLTERQKEAWNNVIKKLEKLNSTTADIVIVASMILNQAASHWNFSTGKK